MVGLGSIGFEFEAQINLAEKQPGAEIARHQIGVLALPAEPGALGERLFHYRGGVDKQFESTRPARLDPMRERFEAALQGVVIVASLRVDRDNSAVLRVQ